MTPSRTTTLVTPAACGKCEIMTTSLDSTGEPHTRSATNNSGSIPSALLSLFFFHHLKNYGSHHLISAVGRTEEKTTTCTDKDGEPIMSKDSEGKEKPRTVTDGKLSGICQNMEKLISFSWGQFRFVDSYAFLSSSLDRLVQNTPKENLCITSGAYFCLGRGTLRQLMDKKFDLVTRKGVYPYDYMDSSDRFEETQLPPKESFYSSLTDESISDPDYQHAQEVWTTFDCQTIGDYTRFVSQNRRPPSG